MSLENKLRGKKKLPPEITPIEVMRFMGGWSCEDYNNAPAKFISTVIAYMQAISASRDEQFPNIGPMGPPEAFKRIAGMGY